MVGLRTARWESRRVAADWEHDLHTRPASQCLPSLRQHGMSLLCEHPRGTALTSAFSPGMEVLLVRDGRTHVAALLHPFLRLPPVRIAQGAFLILDYRAPQSSH